VWLLLDVIAVLAFAALGRRSHAEGIDVAGVLATAWPFLVGVAGGWLASRAWRRPLAVLPTGLVTLVATVAVGMLLRVATGSGTAASFVVVATLVLAALIVGWRMLARLT
jgi:hypothetical protein